MNIKNHAFALLARRSHSQYELRQKLARKNASVEDIDETIRELEQLNLINDKQFAENYTRYRSNQGFGPLKIAMELKKKGINKKIISEIFEEYRVIWLQTLVDLYTRKFQTQTENLSLQEKAKQQRFLLGRGFSADAIQSLIFSNTKHCNQ